MKKESLSKKFNRKLKAVKKDLEESIDYTDSNVRKIAWWVVMVLILLISTWIIVGAMFLAYSTLQRDWECVEWKDGEIIGCEITTKQGTVLEFNSVKECADWLDFFNPGVVTNVDWHKEQVCIKEILVRR